MNSIRQLGPGLMISATVMLCAPHVLAEPSAASDQPSAPRIYGRWAKLTKLETLSRLPVIGEISLRTEVVSLIDVAPGPDGDVHYREKTCRIESDTLAGFVKTAYPPPFLRILKHGWTPAEVSFDNGVLRFAQPRRTAHYGFRSPDDADHGVPTDVDDPRVIDQDRDGRPGVTIDVSGLIGGQLYAAVQEWSESEGRLVGRDRIEGHVRWDAELQVLDATSGALRSNNETRPNPDPDAHWFVMRSIPNGASCSQLLRRVDRVFAGDLDR